MSIWSNTSIYVRGSNSIVYKKSRILDEGVFEAIKLINKLERYRANKRFRKKTPLGATKQTRRKADELMRRNLKTIYTFRLYDSLELLAMMSYGSIKFFINIKNKHLFSRNYHENITIYLDDRNDCYETLKRILKELEKAELNDFGVLRILEIAFTNYYNKAASQNINNLRFLIYLERSL